MRILLIEDEADLLASLALALREEGYAVDTEADGEEGLYKATEVAYDAIVLDVHVSNLRKKLGHELIETRRGHGYCIE